MLSSCKIAKNQQKIDEKSMQNWNWKKTSKKCFKNWIRKGLGLHLGGVWDALGRLLVAPERFLVTFLTFKIDMFYDIAPREPPSSLFSRF